MVTNGQSAGRTMPSRSTQSPKPSPHNYSPPTVPLVPQTSPVRSELSSEFDYGLEEEAEQEKEPSAIQPTPKVESDLVSPSHRAAQMWNVEDSDDDSDQRIDPRGSTDVGVQPTMPISKSRTAPAEQLDESFPSFGSFEEDSPQRTHNRRYDNRQTAMKRKVGGTEGTLPPKPAVEKKDSIALEEFESFDDEDEWF